MTIRQPSLERLALAKQWWQALPSPIKGNESIWTILAMYAEYVLESETVAFSGEEPPIVLDRTHPPE